MEKDAVTVLTDLLALPAAIAALRAEVAEMKGLLQDLQASQPPALISPTEAAARLGVSRSTVRRMIATKRLRAVQIGETVRVDLSSIQATLKVLAKASTV